VEGQDEHAVALVQFTHSGLQFSQSSLEVLYVPAGQELSQVVPLSTFPVMHEAHVVFVPVQVLHGEVQASHFPEPLTNTSPDGHALRHYVPLRTLPVWHDAQVVAVVTHVLQLVLHASHLLFEL
jgi:hypothetical protein